MAVGENRMKSTQPHELYISYQMNLDRSLSSWVLCNAIPNTDVIKIKEKTQIWEEEKKMQKEYK